MTGEPFAFHARREWMPHETRDLDPIGRVDKVFIHHVGSGENFLYASALDGARRLEAGEGAEYIDGVPYSFGVWYDRARNVAEIVELRGIHVDMATGSGVEHVSGFAGTSLSICLFGNYEGADRECPGPVVDASRYLIAVLKKLGHLTSDCWIGGHNDRKQFHPTAAFTQCPGTAVKARLDDFKRPWQPAQFHASREEDEMRYVLVVPEVPFPDGDFAGKRPTFFTWRDAPIAWQLSREELEQMVRRDDVDGPETVSLDRLRNVVLRPVNA
jgi:hypothetical protein